MRSRKITTSVLSGAAMAGLSIAGSANAALFIDVRAFTRNGTAVSNPKLVNVSPGDTIVFRVFADVTGADDSVTYPDCLQSLSGSFLSTGSLRGDLSLTNAGITAPFNALPTTGGAITDLDGDGDLDLGSNNPADPEGFFVVRAAVLTGPRSTDYEGSTVFPPGAAPTDIPHGTEYRIVSTLRMIITGDGGSTLVNFRTRPSPIGGFWAEDASEVTGGGDLYGSTGYTGGHTFTDTTNVQGGGVLLTIPEPTTLGLGALAGIEMLARRRRQIQGQRAPANES